MDGSALTESEAELLVGRVVDGAATAEDVARLEILAAAEPTLWRLLAARSRETALLEQGLDDVIERCAERVELPRRWIAPLRMTWTLALSGWAALVIVVLSWSLITVLTARARHGLEVVREARLSPEEHLQRYLEAPYVLGHLPPSVLDVEKLSDGRLAVTFLRRIEEVTFLDPSTALPIDEEGELLADPAVLRNREPKVGFPDVRH